ncbi:MAG: quinohemoprotein amine dehydrogenase subunit alpha, partial [Gammaproteobacteria bacterium]|nr:quinohemoprotein amine dehydrogenase subunit alpha [Gammaproteobacteria bacterium]
IGVRRASWAVAPATDTAKKLEDTKYAGNINETGMFMPAVAGPNPARPYGTNNAGDLAIMATVKDAGNEVTGSGHLVVTVQRWNDPPIR